MSLGRSLVLACLGFVLGGVVVGTSLALREAGRTLSGIESAAASVHRAGAQSRPRDAVRYREALLALGLTDDETKPLVLQMLEQAARRGHERAPLEYWRDGRAASVRAALERLRTEGSIRSELRALYGSSAERDPAFARLFRPLAPRLDFLGSDQQVRLLEARLTRRLEQIEAAGVTGPRPLRVRYEASRTGWSEGAGARLDADPAAEAETLLGARSGYEVALRDSALAEQLRTSGVELTEAEFRETYRVLATLSAGPSADAFGSAREALRSLLGSDRFDRVWAGRDAVFAVVAPLLRRQGIAEATVLAAYSVMNRSQDELVQATRLNAIDPARAIELAREVAAREEARLGSLIGAELARRVLTARAQAFLERSPVASLDSSPSQGESP